MYAVYIASMYILSHKPSCLFTAENSESPTSSENVCTLQNTYFIIGIGLALFGVSVGLSGVSCAIYAALKSRR